MASLFRHLRLGAQVWLATVLLVGLLPKGFEAALWVRYAGAFDAIAQLRAALHNPDASGLDPAFLRYLRHNPDCRKGPDQQTCHSYLLLQQPFRRLRIVRLRPYQGDTLEVTLIGEVDRPQQPQNPYRIELRVFYHQQQWRVIEVT